MSDSESDSDIEPETFHHENLVIITSTMEINMMQWKMHIEENWERLMTENTRLLVLAGVHGRQSGSLGANEDKVKEAFVETSLRQTELLKKEFEEDIKRKNIVFSVKDVGAHRNRSELDSDKFVSAVKEFRPTMILLAFCWSQKSELNNLLRAAGIYSTLILREDLAQITEDRHVHLDQSQERLISKVSEVNPKNVFVWGTSGSGKTLMLAEALRMKTSQREREGKQVRVFISIMFGESLMSDLKQKYLPNLTDVGDVTVRFVHLVDLATELDVKYNRNHPRATLENILASLSDHHDTDPNHTILVVDEVIPQSDEEEQSGGIADWSYFSSSQDGVDIILALGTFTASRTLHKVKPPSDLQFVCQRLTKPHRNSKGIQRFMRFFLHHSSCGYLSIEGDQNSSHLPPGCLPIWIERSREVHDDQVLAFIASSYLEKTQKGTVLFKGLGMTSSPTSSAERWCMENGWRYEEEVLFFGCEDQFLVMIDVLLQPEYITRGRNLLVMVTTRGKNKDNEKILQDAVQHKSLQYNCTSNKAEKVCPYIGERLIGDKVRLGSEEEHKEWDDREELREKLLTKYEVLQGVTGEKKEFIYKLLKDDTLVDTLRSIEKGGGTDNITNGELEKTLELLIKQKKKYHIPERELRDMKNVLERCGNMALGDYGQLSEGTLSELLQHEDIFDATAALKKDFSNASVSGLLLRNLWVLLANFR